MTHTSWLWPDHSITKTESRALREEHNALLNSHAELLEALRGLLAWYAALPEPGNVPNGLELSARLREGRSAIQKAGGRDGQ